jgi:hypothetical protein
MNTEMILGLFLFVVVVVAASIYFTKFINDKKVDISKVPDSSLRPVLQKLIDKLEVMELEDKKNRDKISALQVMSGIDREQTKYLSANVNALVKPSST